MRGAEEDEEEDDSELAQSISRLDSLISLSSSIKSFPGKWHPIRISLSNLRSSLSSLDIRHASVFSDLLASLDSTLEEAHLLAAEDSSAGKLLLKSNLDVLLSKLNLHAQAFTEILSQGLLSRKAIILCKPAVGASREELKLYVKDLYSRTKLNDKELSSFSLSSLNEILLEDDRYAAILAVDFPDFLGLLVKLSESEKDEIQREASRAVSIFSGFSLHRPLLASAGAVASLSRVLERGSLAAKEAAAKALYKMTENGDNSWSVSAHGGVTTLLKICEEEEGRSGDLLISSCGILRNLVGVIEIRRFMIERGAVGLFLKLLESKSEVSVAQAMEFLTKMAEEDEEAKIKILSEGGMERLNGVFDLSLSPKGAKIALRAVEVLCFSPASSLAALVRLGFLRRLVSVLHYGDVTVDQAALMAATRICERSEEANREMGELGFAREIAKKLKSKSMEVREAAAEVLSRMVVLRKNMKRFLQEEDGVENTVLLLELTDNPRTKSSVLFVLLAVCDSGRGRKRIARSGCVQKLDEIEMEEARKIVKKVSNGRLQSLLGGFWSV